MDKEAKIAASAAAVIVVVAIVGVAGMAGYGPLSSFLSTQTVTYSFGCDGEYDISPAWGACGDDTITFDFGEVKTVISMNIAWYSQIPGAGGSNKFIQIHISTDNISWYFWDNLFPPSPKEYIFPDWANDRIRYVKFKVPDYYPDLVIHWVHGDVTMEGEEEGYTLSTSVDPSGTGSVTLDPCSITYPEGTQVTLTAHPSSGYTFDHWSGDASGSSISTTVIMNSDKSVTAHFQGPGPETVGTIDVSESTFNNVFEPGETLGPGELATIHICKDSGTKAGSIYIFVAEYPGSPDVSEIASIENRYLSVGNCIPVKVPLGTPITVPDTPGGNWYLGVKVWGEGEPIPSWGDPDHTYLWNATISGERGPEIPWILIIPMIGVVCVGAVVVYHYRKKGD